ncbi:MAG TPA: hypothetical protein VMH05_12120 [Bryobacteraceae bacterium]|nr:hypothetical protein [Bryobacteraceae bacterium]
MARQALILVTVVLIFGVLVPLYKGVTILLQPTIILAYALMALLFVAPAASEFWAAIPTPVLPGAVLSRILAIVGYGWGIAVVMLITALVTLNLANRSERILVPPRPYLAATLVFSLAASAATAVLCALLAGRFSAATTKAILRGFFLLLLIVLAFGSRVLPDSWQIVLAEHSTRRAITRLAWQGSVVSAVVATIGLLFLLRRSGVKSQAAAS